MTTRRIPIVEPSVSNQADARRAALVALSALTPFEPVARVDYRSQGRLLIIADDATRARQAVDDLKATLTCAVLWRGNGALAAAAADVVAGELISLSGHLGAFELVFRPQAGAEQAAPFDLVLDLRAAPAFRMADRPQGYYHAAFNADYAVAVAELPQMVGEFEKPKFFSYKESLCAHSRSKKDGCSRCIEVCSTGAIRANGDIVEVDAHLCMGCGGCATVCPSGAMSYQYPRVADRGTQLKAMLKAYSLAAAGSGEKPLILFHAASRGEEISAANLPGNILPLDAWHVASIGIDLLLGTIALGAGGVAILPGSGDAPAYRLAQEREIELAQLIVNALGYSGRHFSIVDTPDALRSNSLGAVPAVAAGFNLSNDKRTTLEFAVEHLLAHAPVKPESIDLPRGSLFGTIEVARDKCTLCMACVGACPSSALMDGGEVPQLRFLERNCVQCGLCATTCPESAIALVPRLLLTPARRETRVLNEAEPFHCVQCGKVLGTRQLIDAMLGRLKDHSMFKAEGALKRLQMCADCRVVDMMANPAETSVMNVRTER